MRVWLLWKKSRFWTKSYKYLWKVKKTVSFQIEFFSELLCGVPRTRTCNNIDRKQSHLFFTKGFRAEKLDFYLKISTYFFENGVDKNFHAKIDKFNLWEVHHRSILLKILRCFVNSVKSYSDFSEWGLVNFQYFEERSNLLHSASTTTTCFLLHHFYIRIIK